MKSLLTPFILTFALVLSAQAKQVFKSTTVVQVHPSMMAISPLGKPGTLMTQNYLKNEFESIVAPATLRIAAKTLKLDLTQDKDALKTLREKITTKPIRGTDLIEISAHSTSKEDALKTVNAVTSAYMNRRKEAELTRANHALAALDTELITQSTLVAEHREELTTLIQKFGIPYFDGGAAPKAKSVLYKESLAAIQKAKPEDKLAVAAAIPIPNNPVTPLYHEYHKALEKLDFLSQTFLEKHPKNVSARAIVNNARGKANQAIGQLITLLQIQEANPPAAKPQPKDDDIVALSLRQHNYNQAKEAYEQSRSMLREMKLKQQEARVLLKMPRSPVTIHERAKTLSGNNPAPKRKTLKRAIIAQRNLVRERREVLAASIQAKGIPHFDDDNSLEKTEQEMFRSARQKLADFETQADQLEIQSKKLIELPDKNLIKYAAGLDLPNNQVTLYSNQYRKAMDEKLEMLDQGLGKTHPAILAAAKRAETAKKRAHNEVISLKEVLKTKLALVEIQIERMRKMVSDRKEDSQELPSTLKPYDQAKKAYQESLTNLRFLKHYQKSLGNKTSPAPIAPKK